MVKGRDDAPDHDTLVARAAQLVPMLRANAERTERERRIPAENLKAMEEAGLFSLLVARKCGGYAASIRTYTDVVAELGRGCGSSSWIAFINDATDWLVAQFPEDVQAEVYAAGPHTRVGGIFDASNAKARKAEGGMVISGSWGFGSGCHHAGWTALAVPFPDLPPGPDGEGLVLVPMSELSIKDTWYVAGMAGTGSDTVIADEVFVPARRTMPWAPALGGYYPEYVKGTVFRAPFVPAVILMAVAPILGLAQAALEHTLERLGKGKRLSYTAYVDARQAPGTQMGIADAATLIHNAVLLIHHWAGRMDAAALANADFDYVTRAQVRMDIGHAIRMCRAAIDTLLDVQGASSFALSNPLQRIWRDLSTASRHAILSPEIAQEIYGKALLDVPNTVTGLV